MVKKKEKKAVKKEKEKAKPAKKNSGKVKKSPKKERKMLFEVEGDNDDLGGYISFDLDEEPKIKSENVFKKTVKSDEEDEEESGDDDGEGKIDLDGEIKYLKVKASKSVSQIKKGDKVKVDGLALEVDSQYVLIDHGKTKEMAIELFDSKTDKDYQLRYFSDQVETSMEFYELEEIVYNKKDAEKVEW